MNSNGIVEQIHGCARFFNSQGGLLGESSKQASLGAMARSVISAIKLLQQLSIMEAAALNEAIAASPFGADHKADMAEAVAAKCVSMASAPKAARRCTQSLVHIENFLTDADWALIAAPGTQTSKVVRVMDRLYMLGITNPSEATIRAAAAAVAHGHCPSASPAQLHGIVLELKSVGAARKSLTTPLPHIAVYPATPQDLPQQVLRAAYMEGDVAVERPSGELEALKTRIPLRNTNKTIGGGPPTAAAAAPAPSMQDLLAALVQHYSSGCSSADAARITFLGGGGGGGSGGGQAAAHCPPPFALAAPERSPAGVVPPSPLGRDLWHSKPSSSWSSPSPLGAVADVAGDALPLQADAADEQLPGGEFCAPPSKLFADKENDLDADMSIRQLELMAAGKLAEKGAGGAPKVAAKRGGRSAKAKATPPAKAKAKAKPPAKPPAKAAPQKDHAKKGKTLLGCSKCRGAPTGCSQCRNPAFGGARWQRK